MTCHTMVLSALVLMIWSCLTIVRADITVIDTERENTTLTSFSDMPAGFGDDFPEDGLQGYLVSAIPKTACSQLLNPAPKDKRNYKWILLIERGGGNHCEFADKVLNAQMNNYDAAIVYDDKQENRLPVMRGGSNGSLVHIPSTFVGMTSGQILDKDFTYSKGSGRYIINIVDEPEFDYRMYLWPFAIVVAACFLMVMIFLVIKFIREHARQRLSRLSTKHLKKIPVRKYKKGDYYDTCAICLDEYEENEKIRVLPCDHVYHTKCIDPWLTKNKKTCPVCKRRVIPGRDADSEDSDSDGGSERRPLLPGASGRSPSSPYGLNQAPPNQVQVHDETEAAQATGGVGISEVPPPRGAEDERPDSAEERRRRRMDRERRHQARSAHAEASGTTAEGAAAFSEQLTQALERDETKEERRERKKKRKEAKKKKRTSSSRPDPAASTSDATDVVVPDLLDSAPRSRRATTFDDEDEFMSCRSSFRDVDDSNTSVQIDEEEEERKRELERERESYVNPSYSDSGEVVVPPGRRELNEVV